MAFELSEEQRELAGTVDRLLADSLAGPRGRQLIERPDGWRELWEAVADLGVPAMAAPEQAGGLALGPVELVAVAEAVGRHLAPGPIVATAGAFVPTLALVAPEADALRAVAEEGRTGGLAVAGDGPAADGSRAAGDFAHVRDGRVTVDLTVPDAAALDFLAIALTDADGSPAIALLERARLTIADAPTIDATRPLSRVTVDGAELGAQLFAAPPGALAVAYATAAAELVGLADGLLRTSVEYARERQQFGVAIGSFQAIKHRLADVLIAVERARSHVWRSAVVAAEQPGSRESDTAARFAKATASEAATVAARAAVQVHGGIGITREHDVSLLYLRARQASLLLGGADEHYLAAVAQELHAPAGGAAAEVSRAG